MTVSPVQPLGVPAGSHRPHQAAPSFTGHSGAAIGERRPRDRHELEVVAAGVKIELENAGRVRGIRLGVPDRSRKRVVARATGSDHELAQPPRVIAHTPRGLWSEALVVVVVAGEDHVGSIVVQRLP